MTRSSKIWRAVAGLYAVINVGGLIYAALEEQEMHAMLHLFLLIIGLAGFLGWWFARRGPARAVPQPQIGDERVEYLQQSVDAMALEVERIGEAQRFADKLKVEKGETPPQKKDH
jgi:hypothetical protein